MKDGFTIKEYHKFRHAAELKKDTHGGYLEGSLSIPIEFANDDFELELSLVPSSFSSREEHPNLLHFTELLVGKKKRKVSAFKTEMTENCWKTVFYFSQSSSEVLHYFSGGKIGNEIISIQNCRQGNSIIFGGENGLTLTIITPLQNLDREGKGVKISDVLKNRYSDKSSDWQQNTDFHDPKIELHRCRMQAVFRCPLKQFEASFFSNNIFDLSDKYVGRLSIQAIHNFEDQVYTTFGKKEITLISKYKIDPKEVCPIIMIKSEKGHLEDPSTIYQGFLQIPPKEIKCYHNLTYIFDIPSQNPDVLSHISNTTFYICLHRKIDKRTSDPIKAFQFIDDFTKDLLTTLTQEVIDSEEDEAFFCNSLESGFVSSEPSPLMNIPNNYPLTPNNDLFHSCMDIDITDMNICNFPMDPDYISMDKGKNTYSSAEKKDFDTLTNILKVSSGISINRRTKVSEVTGFPTLRIRNSREDKESNVNSPDLCDPDENKYTKSVHELYTKQKLYVGAALIIIIGLIFFVIYRLR